MGEPDHAPPIVLLLDGPAAIWLAPRVEALGYRVLRVETIDDAHRAIEDTTPEIACALVPAELADKRLKRALKRLRGRAKRGQLNLTAVGPAPNHEGRKWLRAALVRSALWEPFDDGMLRFQLNRLTLSSPPDAREAVRVPSGLIANAPCTASPRPVPSSRRRAPA
jgi:hypothetical protein